MLIKLALTKPYTVPISNVPVLIQLALTKPYTVCQKCLIQTFQLLNTGYSILDRDDDPDPDPTFHFAADPYPDPTPNFTNIGKKSEFFIKFFLHSSAKSKLYCRSRQRHWCYKL